MKNSLTVKSFLDFVSRSETEAELAKETLDECDKETQDILHYLEFHDAPYLERKKINDLLPSIRRERRKAKDTNAVLLDGIDSHSMLNGLDYVQNGCAKINKLKR